MICVISQRKYLELKRQKRLLAWQTRTICQYIACTVRTDKGKTNKLFESAGSIILDALEMEELEAAQSRQEDKPRANPVGSYERLMGMKL